MECHRICRKAHRALDGEGARLYGGRWNSPGEAVVYASATLALAALEYLIHLDSSEAPLDLMAIRIAIPDDVADFRRASADVTGALASLPRPRGLPRRWRCVAGGPENRRPAGAGCAGARGVECASESAPP